MSVIKFVDLHSVCLGSHTHLPKTEFYVATKTTGSLLLAKVTDISVAAQICKRLLASSFVFPEEYSSLSSHDEALCRKIVAKHKAVLTKTNGNVEVFEFTLGGDLIQRHRILNLPE